MADPALIAWTFAAMLHTVPVERQLVGPWADPSLEVASARYVGISVAIADVCDGAKSERDCAALLVAIGAGESGFARDADVGPCHRAGGYRTRCDSGAAASVWQVQRWTAEVTIADLFADRRIAAAQALRVARASLSMCRALPVEDRLSGLSGRCQAGPGPWRARMKAFQALRSWEPTR